MIILFPVDLIGKIREDQAKTLAMMSSINDTLSVRLDLIEKRLESIEKRQDAMQSDGHKVRDTVARMEAGVSSVAVNVSKVSTTVSTVADKVHGDVSDFQPQFPIKAEDLNELLLKLEDPANVHALVIMQLLFKYYLS